MSAVIVRLKISNICALLAMVLLWISGAASLTHNDMDSDDLIFSAHQSQLRLPSAPTPSDVCAACAWNGAGITCIPASVAAPVEKPYSFGTAVSKVVRIGVKTLAAATLRGPPQPL